MKLSQVNCKNVLCIRADNMGDIIMSGPAMRALKETLQCRITLLTSPMGAPITTHIPEVDKVIACEIPWVKAGNDLNAEAARALTERIKNESFDAAIIFTVYSQNPLPAALLTYLAGIPVRLAYCRENPYGLLTHWVPDQEPYTFIQHQVARDLKLVETLGAFTSNNTLQLKQQAADISTTGEKLRQTGITGNYIVLHPGVSEEKRKYPVDRWAATARLLSAQHNLPVVISGSAADAALANAIVDQAEAACRSMAGKLNMAEWISLLDKASLLVSVNTGAIHISAAVQTPTIVLYALTNPQHTPWRSPAIVLPFSVPGSLKSRNEVIKYVDELLFTQHIAYPAPKEVAAAAASLLLQPGKYISTSIIDLNSNPVVDHCL
ncbi:glycosyltransferase family 9 protein [Filimonas effusa]|uniref:Glycosyltransferase family 9 protein n=1 Tax=Filimonas effusa TaxID=2508721 RepID=A0A4V1MA30_9BACT|nr:glycosyltransferase family 9 protein [Filimonas effusa]RXK83744.1 glycosyltransferase family 9 protein [Filimonas effusa]